MVIVRLNGGLGNQLFQYATGRAVANRFSQPLVVDDRAFRTDNLRGFCLSRFHADYTLASDNPMVEAILPPARKRWLAYAGWRLRYGNRLTYVKERSLEFDPSLFACGPGAYLHGYWQSEQYFRDIADLLKQELTVREPVSGENQSWLDEIASGVSVSLHIRRGDYVSDPKANRVHGICALDYYQRALERLSQELGWTSFSLFVFSDDPDWVEANWTLPYRLRTVRHNGDSRNYEDLRLMMACHHHIIANSSFSWWGAWLGHHPQRVVIAPKKWFNDPLRSDRSLVPDRWLRL